MIYACPSSTPVPALRAMAGMLDMESRIYLEKVTLVSSILFKHEDQESYAREMLEEEMKQGWLGLSSEVMEICKKTGLPDVTKEFVSSRRPAPTAGRGRTTGPRSPPTTSSRTAPPTMTSESA